MDDFLNCQLLFQITNKYRKNNILDYYRLWL